MYSDYYDYDSSDSEESFTYHNYSVDYANQLLRGEHQIISTIPASARFPKRRRQKLVRVATLDQMPNLVTPRRQPFITDISSIHSRPKYNEDSLPPIQDTSAELERRAQTRQRQFGSEQQAGEQEENYRINDQDQRANQSSKIPPAPPIPAHFKQPTQETQEQHHTGMPYQMNNADIAQLQQQQQLFNQQMINMQNHPHSMHHHESHHHANHTHSHIHDINREDDQAYIAHLIDTDPYFATAMQDFGISHGIWRPRLRNRSSSGQSTENISTMHRHLCDYHSAQHRHHRHRAYSKSPSSSSLSSVTSLTSASGENIPNNLLNEIRQIRKMINRYLDSRQHTSHHGYPQPNFFPVPWPVWQPPQGYQPQGYQPPIGTPHVPSQNYIPPEPPPPSRDPFPHIPANEPRRALYQNIVNTIKDVLSKRDPSKQDQPLKPSEIAPGVRKIYTRRPRFLPSPSSQQQNRSVVTNPPILPLNQQRRRSSVSSRNSSIRQSPLVPKEPSLNRNRSSLLRQKPPIPPAPPLPPSNIPPAPPFPPSLNVPPAPPYEPLARFTSTSNRSSSLPRTRNLSYGAKTATRNTVAFNRRPSKTEMRAQFEPKLYDKLRPEQTVWTRQST